MIEHWTKPWQSEAARRRAMRIGLAVAAGLVAVGATASAFRSVRNGKRCVENLQAIYEVMHSYDQRNGALPDLAFFPPDVRRDLDSLYVVLGPFGLLEPQCVCPSADPVLAEAGITYIWNVSLNGKSLSSQDVPVWMLVEIHALSASVPAPHRGAYHVLYTDGRVEREANPPAIL